MTELEKAIAYFEDAIMESEEIIAECSPSLRDELEEQKTHFEVALKAMREQEPWRPVLLDPPKVGERVLVTSGKFVGEGYMMADGSWYRHSGISWSRGLGLQVTHWKPLPEAWGEEHYEDR